jgi:hypothetical protein
VFSLTPPSVPGGAWTKTTVFVFGAIGAGSSPDGLVLGTDGNLYGTTIVGGKKCERRMACGTVFELIAPASPGGAWTERIIHKFAGTATQDGAQPKGGLSVGPDGTMYGTTKRRRQGQWRHGLPGDPVAIRKTVTNYLSLRFQ